MIAVQSGSALSIRESETERQANWLFAAVRESQVFACEVDARPRSEIPALIRRFAATLPECSRESDLVLLRGWLMQFGLRWAERDHARIHEDLGSSVRHCHFKVTAPDGCWLVTSPATAFVAWSCAYLAAVNRAHTDNIAAAARRFIDKNFTHGFTMEWLAARLHTSPAGLLREFRTATGASVIAYREQLRVGEGLRLLQTTTWKVEAIAIAVGYRSKKNFYAALRRRGCHLPAVVRRGADEPDQATSRLRRHGRR